MPIKSLYCSPCMKRDKPKSKYICTWMNVETIGVTGDGAGARCKCRNCGHTWNSRSRAGRRAAQRFTRDNAAPAEAVLNAS